MPIILALDIGLRRTGAALFRPEIGFVIPLTTIEHPTGEDTSDALAALARERNAELIIAGLPLLPSGEEGAQARSVRSTVEALRSRGWTVEFLDERYSSGHSKEYDGDAYAACELLKTFLQKKDIDI